VAGIGIAADQRRNGHVDAPEGTPGPAPPRGSLIGRGLREIAAQVQRRIPRADLDERDPDFIRERLPLQWLLASIWFRGEVRGLGNVPEHGPVLLVGNHSGGNLTPDTTVFTLAFNTYFGVERAFFQLAHNLVLSMPALAQLGPDALEEPLTGAQWHAAAQQSRRPIKPLLMEQAFVSGLGNICAGEILFRAGIAPQRPANSPSSAASHSAWCGSRRAAPSRRGSFKSTGPARGLSQTWKLDCVTEFSRSRPKPNRGTPISNTSSQTLLPLAIPRMLCASCSRPFEKRQIST